MPEYVPYRHPDPFTIRPKNQPIAPNLLGVATKKGLPLPKFPPGKYSKNMLQYPEAVTEGFDYNGAGHYILFHISTQDKSKIKEAQKLAKKIAVSEEKIKAEMKLMEKEAANSNDDEGYETPTRGAAMARIKYRNAAGKQMIENHKANVATQNSANKGLREGSSLQVSAGRKRLESTIALYMPPTVTVTYAADWAEGEITARGRIAQAGLKAINNGFNKDAVQGLGGAIESGAKQMALGALDAAAPGAKGLIAIEQGKIMTNRMEVMFNGIGRRSFSYSFKFIPRNASEAQTIEEIVHTFKLHAASELVPGSGGKEYRIPHMFDIEYMWGTTENRHLNKIGTSALTSINITYGGEKYVTYEDGTPQSTEMTLDFTEMELMDKGKIREGY